MLRNMVFFKNSSIIHRFSEINFIRKPFLSEDLLGLIIYTTYLGTRALIHRLLGFALAGHLGMSESGDLST